MGDNHQDSVSSNDDQNDTVIETIFYCVQCNKDIGNHDAIQCNNCEQWKHSHCFAKKGFQKAKEKMLWYCGAKCEEESGIDRDVADIQVKTATTSDMMKCMGQFFKQFRDVNNMLKSQKMDTIKSDIKIIKAENRQRDLQVEGLRNEIGELKQNSMNHKVICYNVETDKNVPAIDEMKRILNEKNMTTLLDKMSNCYRLGSKSETPPIVIDFDNCNSKFNFMNEIKNNKKQNKDIKIKVREFLCAEKLELMKEVKAALGSKYKYIWSKNGKIFIREKSGERPACIRYSRDIRELMDGSV